MTDGDISTRFQAQEILNRVFNSSENTLSVNTGFKVPKYDQIIASYPNDTTETYEYKYGGETQATMTVVYTDSTKENFYSVTMT
ncbi:MAG: hypothetical protein IPM48_14955 [Saprospiraceae bacterium]|nr:hypothetical protein [Saprospiraceae bacterium]